MKNSHVMKTLLAGAAVVTGIESSLAGAFDGVTIEVKLISCQQYEGLYARIAGWEAGTGDVIRG